MPMHNPFLSQNSVVLFEFEHSCEFIIITLPIMSELLV
jgi:hypothetical protein